MTERYRLRALQMRISGHYGFDMRFGAINERGLQLSTCATAVGRHALDIQPSIRRDLIVSGSGGMQSTGRFSDQLVKTRLNIDVDVPSSSGFHLKSPDSISSRI